ncbi:hypothetical protein ACFLIM_36270 [Nonomuraea sp. M3C6]|uniref:Uncharacterized protein n=1 Tax=Nonomuraea marmarensis TaxID=3351344 RepID=A0ABW7ARF4_9ACTN
MSELPDFHGPHVRHRADAEVIDWCEPKQRFDRVRIRRHTCECKARVLEFCTTGGLAWVRRTDRLADACQVRESHPQRTDEAEKLWRRLLNGEAR